MHLSVRGTTRSFDGSGSFLIAGRSSDINGWHTALNVLIDAAGAEAASIFEQTGAEAESTFWYTLGTMVRASERGTELREDAEALCVESKTACYAEFGTACQVTPAGNAAEESAIADAARRSLASAAATAIRN